MRVKHIIFTVFIVALLFNVAPVHARLFSNHSEGAFDGGDGTSSTGKATLACSSTIRELIIKGAVSILRNLLLSSLFFDGITGWTG